MTGYAERLRGLAAELTARPQLKVQLWWSEVERFACIQCGAACTRPWKIAIPRAYHRQWGPALMALTGLEDTALFPRDRDDDERFFATLAKKPDSSECIMLDSDGLCRIHRRWGPTAKPGVCQMYPFYALDGGALDGMALSLSCTQAGRMLMQPQELFFRLIDTAATPSQRLWLAAGREISRPAWLIWLGHSLDALVAQPDFGAWLGLVGQDLGRLLRLPPGLLTAESVAALGAQAPPPPLTLLERGQLLAWLQTTVLNPHPAFADMADWLTAMQAAPEQLQLPQAEEQLLNVFLRAYWLRQLLIPAHFLRGELNLVQQMLFTGFQGALIRLRAIWLFHVQGRLGVDELGAAGNQIYAFIAQDHAPEASVPFRGLRQELCLIQLLRLSRWR